MHAEDVLQLLESQKDDRGIRNWERLGERTSGLRSYGIGLTRLRTLARKVGRNRQLAQELWKSDIYEARVVSLLIDDPKEITREQAETQVDELAGGMEHVFSSCDATLAKASFAVEMADEWVRRADPRRKSCGYGLLYEASKLKGGKAPSEKFFLEHVNLIDRTIDGETPDVRLAMGNALMGIGKRSPRLNEAALEVAERVGPISFESASGKCEPFDVAKHLKTDRLKAKLGE